MSGRDGKRVRSSSALFERSKKTSCGMASRTMQKDRMSSLRDKLKKK